MSRKCFELAEQATATTGRRATHRLVGRRVDAPAAFRGRSTGTCHGKTRESGRSSRGRSRAFSPLSAVARAVSRYRAPPGRPDVTDVTDVTAVAWTTVARPGDARGEAPDGFPSFVTRGTAPRRAAPRSDPHCVRLRRMCVYLPLCQSRRSPANVPLPFSLSPPRAFPRVANSIFASGVRLAVGTPPLVRVCMHLSLRAVCLHVWPCVVE